MYFIFLISKAHVRCISLAIPLTRPPASPALRYTCTFPIRSAVCQKRRHMASASVANQLLPRLVTPPTRNMQHLTSLHFTSLLPVSYHARLPQPVFTARTITCGRFEMTMAILHSHCRRRTCPSRAYSAAVSASPFGRVAFISAANIHLRPCLPGPCTVSLTTTSRQAAFHERDLT